jgi:hypothetical protein
MTTETESHDRLARLGDALDRAVRADLATHRRGSRRLMRHPRRLAAGAALAVVVVPAAAFAATQLITTNQVAASLPQGTRALIGTDPTCTVVTANVEYHCVLAQAPSNVGAPIVGGTDTTTTPAQLHGTAEAWFKTPGGKVRLVHAASEPALKHKLLILAARGHRPGATIQAPSSSAATTDWTGTVEPTVDATKHVNGGCRAQNAGGTEWECYIGQAAVQQRIIGQSFLGQYAPAPGVG